MTKGISPGEFIPPLQLLPGVDRPKTNMASLRGVARELGMKPAVLQEFTVVPVRCPTDASVSLNTRQAASAMHVLLSGLLPECREAAERELTETLRNLYRSHPPTWLQDRDPPGRGVA